MNMPRISAKFRKPTSSSVQYDPRDYLLLRVAWTHLFVLHQEGKDGACRLLIVPKKALPNVYKKSDRVYAFVDMTGSIDELVSTLRDTEYETKKGKRKQSGARLIARGVYLLANHKEPKSAHTFTNHVHLAYVRLESAPISDKFCRNVAVGLDPPCRAASLAEVIPYLR